MITIRANCNMRLLLRRKNLPKRSEYNSGAYLPQAKVLLIFSVLAHAEKQFFSKLVLEYSCGRLKTELFDNDELSLAFQLALLWVSLAFHILKGLNL